MTRFSSALGFSILMFAAGVGIPIMAAPNANLGAHIDSPTAAGLVLFVVGLGLTSVAAAFLRRKETSHIECPQLAGGTGSPGLSWNDRNLTPPYAIDIAHYHI